MEPIAKDGPTTPHTPWEGLENALLQRPAQPAPKSDAWTLAALCIGLALVSACVLIPQADSNRQLIYQRQKLLGDLQQIQQQTSVNEQFLQKMESDPQLAERLAQRQLKMVRQGETVLDVQPPQNAQQMSPYMMLSVPPAPAMQPFEPLGGILASFCRQGRVQAWVLGAGLLLIAMGVICGDGKKSAPGGLS
jgi:cell division protein FtsB